VSNLLPDPQLYIVEYEQNGAGRAAYDAGLMDALTSRL